MSYLQFAVLCSLIVIIGGAIYDKLKDCLETLEGIREHLRQETEEKEEDL